MAARSLTKFRPQVEVCEDRAVPASFGSIADDSISVSPDDGGTPRVKIIDPATGEDIGEIQAYEDGFRGGVRSALGDVTGDGVNDIVIAPGTGGAPRLRIIDGSTGNTLSDFLVYEDSFRGGLYVAVGDVNADGRADIITGTGNGGAPRVRVLSGADLGRTVIRDFFAYEDSFRGGVLVAAGDVNADGRDDVITGTGVGGGPRVLTFAGTDGKVLQNFFAYEDSFRGGVLVSAGDIDGDGRDDVITGTGPGGGPVVRVVSAATGATLLQFLADDSSFRGGVGVDSSDIDGDGRDDVVTHTRHGSSLSVNIFDDHGGDRIRTFTRTVDDDGTGTSGGGSGGSGGGTTAVGSQVEGTITAVNVAAGTVTIRRLSGAEVVVTVGPTTKVERNDESVPLSAFRVGDRGEAKFGLDGTTLKGEAEG
jgi:hypothetical protein